MVQRTAFFHLSQSTLREPKIPTGIAYTIISNKIVRKTFMAELA